MFHRKTVLLVCSAGGHLSQMLRLSSALEGFRRHLLTEGTVATRSLQLENLESKEFLPHGGREEGLLYMPKFLLNICLSLVYYLRLRPKVVISTGAHTAVPMCYIAKLFGSKIIFVETFARVSGPSLTGRAVYPIADSFYVQWPKLKAYYPKAKFVGRLY